MPPSKKDTPKKGFEGCPFHAFIELDVLTVTEELSTNTKTGALTWNKPRKPSRKDKTCLLEGGHRTGLVAVGTLVFFRGIACDYEHVTIAPKGGPMFTVVVRERGVGKRIQICGMMKRQKR